MRRNQSIGEIELWPRKTPLLKRPPESSVHCSCSPMVGPRAAIQALYIFRVCRNGIMRTPAARLAEASVLQGCSSNALGNNRNTRIKLKRMRRGKANSGRKLSDNARTYEPAEVSRRQWLVCGVPATLSGSSTAIASLSEMQDEKRAPISSPASHRTKTWYVLSAVMFHDGFFHSTSVVGDDGSGAPRGYDDSHPCRKWAS